ncbi:hypothetical protein Tco_0871502 [Tanacetum coccineum]
MEWLPKCVELEVAAGSQKWLDMMVLYCRKSASEDLKFVRQINRLRVEMIVTCEDMVAFVQELETLLSVVVTAKTAAFSMRS